MNTVRWNIAVSPDTDRSVRMFLAAQGGGRKGDLSRFIEDAVRTYLFERAVKEAKTATAHMSEVELNDLIDEAVQWAREH
ncbi:MAG: ribbon-helix-helix domain-containing protein [Azoarcus sp.]|nr:ribbon-helix-helix domain-containing protein [Azoarcus sp.]